MRIALKLSAISAGIYTAGVFIHAKYGDSLPDEIIFEEEVDGVRQLHFSGGSQARDGHDPGIPRRSVALVLRSTGKIFYYTGRELIRFADDLERPPRD